MMTNAQIIVLALIQYGPEFARQVVNIFQKKEVTMGDWEALFAVYKKSYEDYTRPPQVPPGT